MKKNELKIEITGKKDKNGNERIRIEDFCKVLKNTVGLLGEIEKNITGKKRAKIKWLITDLNFTSEQDKKNKENEK